MPCDGTVIIADVPTRCHHQHSSSNCFLLFVIGLLLKYRDCHGVHKLIKSWLSMGVGLRTWINL